MKTWYAATCPVCGFRFPLTKFHAEMKPIIYPIQLVTGGGRAKGFQTVKYIPWTNLPTLTQTAIWNNLLCLYTRLAAAYDNFFKILGFTSPEMQRMLQELQKPYSSAYQTSPFADYSNAYTSIESSMDVAEVYQESSYADAYTHDAILVLER